MSGLLLRQNDQVFNEILSRLEEEYPYDIDVYRKEYTMTTKVRIAYTQPNETPWLFDFEFDDSVIEKFTSVGEPFQIILSKFVRDSCADVTLALGESVTGKYPFTRLWADKHLLPNNPAARGRRLPKLFGYPYEDIPGWVFPKAKTRRDYPPDDYKPGTHTFGAISRVHNSTKPSPINYNVKDIDMATATKKKVINVPKRKAVDPTKVKKPFCGIHTTTKMEFDAVTNKWRCTVTDCKMVARPKRAEDDRTLTVGKGGIQARLISQNGVVSVVLLSDDNVALDITKLVNVAAMIEEWNAKQLSEVAVEAGKDSFVIEVEKEIMLNGMRLTVMGAEDLIDTLR